MAFGYPRRLITEAFGEPHTVNDLGRTGATRECDPNSSGIYHMRGYSHGFGGVAPEITPIERVGQWQNCPHHRQRQSRRAPERRTARSSYSGVQKHRSGGSSFSRATLPDCPGIGGSLSVKVAIAPETTRFSPAKSI